MKVLLVNKFFYNRGGDTAVFFSTADLLKKRGHSTAFFSMQHPMNLPSEFSPYFVSNVDYNKGNGLIPQLKIAGRLLYSLEAKRKINRLIDKERPDIAHLHNICHQISPSIIDALKKKGVPVVMTLHDYKLTCPVYTHFNNGKVCDECRNGRYYKAFQNKCTKNSGVKSAINVIEMYLHHNVLHIYDKVDMFISPSRFLIEKSRDMGFKCEIVYLPNFLDLSGYQPAYESRDGSITYLGRLSDEKGIQTLIDAVSGLEAIQLKIIGDGPLKEALMSEVKIRKLDNVRFTGFLSGDKLKDEIRRSLFVVIPSEWYENNPRSIVEAFVLGKPVIGARIGGIPELISDGETGLLFEAGNAAELREKIKWLVNNRPLIRDMGKAARKWVEMNLDSGKHYDELMKIYNKAIDRNNKL